MHQIIYFDEQISWNRVREKKQEHQEKEHDNKIEKLFPFKLILDLPKEYVNN